MRFFKMTNRIFDYSLSPNGFIVYSYLLSRMNILQAVIISYQAIAAACNIDPKTVCRAIDELTSQGLITKENRYNILGKAKNKYIINKLSGDWFKVEYSVFSTKIKSSDFMVYCYIKKCMDTQKVEAFPSLTAIAHGTGISRSRVAVAIKYLREYTFINRVKRHYKKTQAYKHNRYIKFKLQQKEKEVRPLKRTSLTQQFIFQKSYFLIHIIERMVKNVKLFFKSRGSPEIP